MRWRMRFPLAPRSPTGRHIKNLYHGSAAKGLPRYNIVFCETYGVFGDKENGTWVALGEPGILCRHVKGLR